MGRTRLNRTLMILVVAMLLVVAPAACGPASQPAPAESPTPAPGAAAAPATPIAGAAVSSSATFFDMEVNRPAADFTLVNQDGKPVSLRDLRGSFVLLDFVYTSCPDVCPLMTATFRRIQDELGGRLGKGVFFVSITLDPEFDTSARLKAYAEAFQARQAGWHFLTGDPDTVYAVAAAYQQTFEIVGERDIDHTALTVLIDPAGMERHRYWGTGYPPATVVERIEALGSTSAKDGALAMAENAAPAAGPLPDQAEIDALLGVPQGQFIFLIDEEEAEKFTHQIADQLLAQGWTEADRRTGPEQEAIFLNWGNEMYIGVGRNLDGVVILQDADPVRLWTEFFDRFKLYCCA